MNCTQDMQSSYRHGCRCLFFRVKRDGFPHSPLFVGCLRILSFVHKLRERTNERTNDYAPFERFVKHPGRLLCNLCYMLMRKGGKVVERNTVCATVLFHGYYYNLLSGRFQPFFLIKKMKAHNAYLQTPCFYFQSVLLYSRRMQ